MRLDALLERLLVKRVIGNDRLLIQGIEVDSRKVNAGDLFICLPGLTVDGHSFASMAVERGASAVLVEREIELPTHATRVFVPDARRAMAILADAYYGHPSHHLKMIGVTGTNGKTTITHMIEKILNDHGRKAGLIGTIQMRIGDYAEKTANTTPEAIELQRCLRTMIDHGAEYGVLEVSSHALDMGRVRGCNFKTVIFTNLTHDHLDYHKTMEQYREAKGLLFSQLGNVYEEQPKVSILNADDPVTECYSRCTSAQVITYGITNRGDVTARDIQIRPHGVSFMADTFRGSIEISLSVTGLFNVYNAMAALAACLVEGLSLEEIRNSLATFTGVRGRFEAVNGGQDFTIIVDYAHNPDGLRNVLQTAKKLTPGKLFCIVGCEGDRDREKRPVMANVAADYADIAILTSDNPRSEEPEAIVEEMHAGLVGNNVPPERYVKIVDRREAIRYAMQQASPNDCVFIAGKGHETHQIVKNSEAIPLDDREIALQYLNMTHSESLQ